MKCILCEGPLIKKYVEHREFGILIGKFNAQVCTKCGEIYFDQQTAEKIQQKSKELGLFGLAKKVKVAEIGNSVAIRIPKEISKFLNLKKGREVTISPESKSELIINI